MAGRCRMETEQRTWTQGAGWDKPPRLKDAALVLLFGDSAALADARLARDAQAAYPGAVVAGGSTAGEIAGTRVRDDTAVATAVRFGATRVRAAEVAMPTGREGGDGSAAAGEALARQLPPQDLAHVLVFSDGLHVNGSELVRGMSRALPPRVAITGGLAGDGARFQRTFTVGPQGVHMGHVVAVGLYGKAIRVGFGSLGGWDPFGPMRTVTRSRGNILQELDGRPALALYKTYLGDHAKGLPAAGLLFPLNVRAPGASKAVTRTILGVSEPDQSLTFAGDIPEGAAAQFMKANFDRLVDGAQGAAQAGHEALRGQRAELAVLISCVGRKLVLKQRTEEELEAVQRVLGPQAALCGFYSYGEICPAAPGANCELHNQTMTVTTLREEA
jgi:hypothetical protein